MVNDKNGQCQMAKLLSLPHCSMPLFLVDALPPKVQMLFHTLMSLPFFSFHVPDQSTRPLANVQTSSCILPLRLLFPPHKKQVLHLYLNPLGGLSLLNIPLLMLSAISIQ